ncbi:hypothetical protein Ancab_010078 [Ancistrocladus abbreviatus]
MGNSLTLCKASCKLEGETKVRIGKVLQVMKFDGKMLEFRASLLVKDLLASHPNSYVGVFREATQPLPPDYKLKIGKIYYLLPFPKSYLDDERNPAGGKRIKVVITKQQLRQLLTKEIGVEDLVFGANQRACGSQVSSTAWMPTLEVIPEVAE